MEDTQTQTRKRSDNKILFIIIAIAVLLFGYVVYSVTQDIKKNKNQNAMETQQATTTLRAAEAGDVIVINYSGKLADGTEFDSSYTRGQPFVFQVGVGQVIPGWDEGLIGAKRGDKKTLTINSDKGYGDQEIKDAKGKIIIPKNSTLIFDVEVVDVISSVDAEKMMAEQKAAMSAASGTAQ